VDLIIILIGVLCIGLHYVLKGRRSLPGIIRGAGAKFLLYLGILVTIGGFFR